jgi:hypothetical protein
MEWDKFFQCQGLTPFFYVLEGKQKLEIPNEAFHRIGEERRSPPGDFIL